jgi:hypothetical protein
LRQLVHPLRTRQVPQANNSAIDQDDLFRKVMSDQLPNSSRQQYLPGVTDLSKVMATACDQPLGVHIASRRVTGIKCETKGPPDTSSGSCSGGRDLDVENEGERIGCTVETCEEALVLTLEGSRPSMATEEILEEGVQSFDNGGSVWIQRSRSDQSRRLGGQHDRDSWGNAHDQISPGTAVSERGKRHAVVHSPRIVRPEVFRTACFS